MCFAKKRDIVYSCIRETKCFPLKGFISPKNAAQQKEWQSWREEAPDGTGISIPLISQHRRSKEI